MVLKTLAGLIPPGIPNPLAATLELKPGELRATFETNLRRDVVAARVEVPLVRILRIVLPTGEPPKKAKSAIGK
jgi:hypothetical protein